MTHLKVAVRVRPLSLREIEDNSTVILSVENGKTVAITNIKVPEQNAGDSRERVRRFTFDFCFHQNSTQNDVFQAIEGVVNKAIQKRHHSCVLAYGQSSTGKTHTMMGFPHEPGLTPRLCQHVFGYLEKMAVGSESSNDSITVSYLEIYNEKVRDLFNNEENCHQLLKIRQHPKKGPYVQGLREHSVTDSVTLVDLLERGNGNRRVAATLTNPQSSRSHSVFVLTLDGVKITLVDLAGSERAGNRSYSTSRLREGANINKSLVALGNVITALAEDSTNGSKGIRKRFIPYRDSILTWLLKDTLGGNSDTVMIATISPSSTCYSETVNTLRFGQRAKLIVSIPVVNEDPKERTIRELREEIARLKELLQQKQLPIQLPPEPVKDFEGEDLIPTMNSNNQEVKPTPSKLHRTNSADQSLKKMESDRKFGSEETIVKKPPRKDSIDKKRDPKKTEKNSITDMKLKVEAKVDSIRKTPIKPRSQIVAAVTNRLYVKTKKKDVAVDTSDMPNPTIHRELSICSNARQQLKELSRKAVKSQKYKTEETQTELFPVLRVKETGTDVCDLKTSLDEVKHAETSTVTVPTEDKEISCTFLDSANNIFLVTKSCGTQATEKPPMTSSVSFTKYLRDFQQPRMDIFNPHTANPIYTNSVNINISHNYINGQKVSDSVSDDSLDEQSNLCFPTPDLISNHNSLEPHATTKETVEMKMCQAKFVELEQNHSSVTEIFQEKPVFEMAASTTIPEHKTEPYSINIPQLYAAETCIIDGDFQHRCEYFLPSVPDMARCKIVECKSYCDDCVKIVEPLVLKSIMKHLPECKKEEAEEPDAMDKKVRFTEASGIQNERMIRAMSCFLEEATVLMNTLTTAAHRLDHEQEYDVQVTINGLEQHKCRRKRKMSRNSVTCQTEEKTVRSDYIQTELDIDIPTNKYELLLEDSCKRLEQKIAAATEDNLVYNSWDLSVQEDTSLESNPITFSDYGSLPRRRRRASCTPSAYLRQLATMRRQVVEASREELSNNSESSVA